MIINVSGVSLIAEVGLDALRDVAKTCKERGQQLVFVCTELMCAASSSLPTSTHWHRAAERRRSSTAGQHRCLNTRVTAAPVRIGHTVPVADRQRRSLRLRTRVTLFFSLTALVASLALAVVTYGVARNFLVDQRSQVILNQAVSERDDGASHALADPATSRPARSPPSCRT
jgi:hypothetical protein